jgi:hypothetical protein
MRALLLALGLIAFATACTDSESVAVAATATVMPQPSVLPQPSAVTATGTATPMPTVAATEMLESAASATPTAVSAPEVRLGDASGVPFSTLDVRLAVEEGRGYSFWLIEEREVPCAGSAVRGHPYWSANLAGSDFGPLFVLWVYPDIEALRKDWDAVPGEAPKPQFDCEPPSGFVYWNENLIMAFDVWFSLGEAIFLEGHWKSPSDMPAVEAFLELVPS